MIAIRYLNGPLKMGQPSRLFNGEPLEMAEHTWFSLGLFHPYAWNSFRPLLRTVFWAHLGKERAREKIGPLNSSLAQGRASRESVLFFRSVNNHLLQRHNWSFRKNNELWFDGPNKSSTISESSWIWVSSKWKLGPKMYISCNFSINCCLFVTSHKNLLQHQRLSAAHAFVL